MASKWDHEVHVDWDIGTKIALLPSVQAELDKAAKKLQTALRNISRAEGDTGEYSRSVYVWRVESNSGGGIDREVGVEMDGARAIDGGSYHVHADTGTTWEQAGKRWILRSVRASELH